MADVLGQPVLTLSEGQATSRGIALLGLEALGIIDDTTSLPPATGQVYEPNVRHHRLYRDALEQQIELYDLVVVGR